MSARLAVDFGPEVCGCFENATRREWLVTNGLGGFACGTVSGALTRRYHGLLIAAPGAWHGLPGARLLLVSKVEETVRYAGRSYSLGANRWAGASGLSISPDGFRFLERFQLRGTVPVWTFGCADALVEKRVWMQDGANTTFVRYELSRASESAEMEIKVLVNYRDMHGLTGAADLPMEVAPVGRGLCVVARQGAMPLYLLSDAAVAEAKHEWYLNFDLAEERFRGLGSREDHLLAAVFRARLAPGVPLTLVLSTDSEAPLDGTAAFAAQAAREEKLLEYWIAAQPQASLEAPAWIRQLVLGAAQFLVRRTPIAQQGPARTEARAQNEESAGPGDSSSYGVIAGYPWFGEWGRDTMVALPGLAIETGRLDVARMVLRDAASLIDEGMLPNQFPEEARPAQYNSVDAALWYVEALRQYQDATSDRAWLREFFGILSLIVNRYARGTRYSIHMDEADGLLYAGEPGLQLTWMDAKVGDRVITPRIGKPIEVNALWYNALRTMARFAFILDKPMGDYIDLAERAQQGFQRFWNAEAGYCFDVLDGPGGHDAALRPNQLLAISLPESPLSMGQRAAVLDVCARRLITSFGLRSLDPADAHYRGQYGGPQTERDAAYHQGTAWAWLLGPFVLAHLRVHHDPQTALTFLEPMTHHLAAYGLGSVSEIFEGRAPFAPRGAPRQAWSVAEVLRAWHACYNTGSAGPSKGAAAR